MSNNTTLIPFNPNDFYYYTNDQTPSKDECNNMDTSLLDTGKCDNSELFNEHHEECLQQVLCKNRTLAETLQQGGKNSGVDGRLEDVKTMFGIEQMDIMNYTLGVLLVGGLLIGKIYQLSQFGNVNVK